MRGGTRRNAAERGGAGGAGGDSRELPLRTAACRGALHLVCTDRLHDQRRACTLGSPRPRPAWRVTRDACRDTLCRSIGFNDQWLVLSTVYSSTYGGWWSLAQMLNIVGSTPLRVLLPEFWFHTRQRISDLLTYCEVSCRVECVECVERVVTVILSASALSVR